MPTSVETAGRGLPEGILKLGRTARRAWLMLGPLLGFAMFHVHAHPAPLLAIELAAFLLFWMIWIIRRPEPGVRP